MDIVLIFFICLLGSVVQGATGFGMSILCMAILPMFIPFKTAILVVLFAALSIAIQIAIKLRTHINFKLMIFPMIGGLVGRTIGIQLLMCSSEYILKLFLGILLIVLSIYFAFFNRHIRIKASAINGILAGLLSGILGGMYNIGGPPLVVYYLNASDDKMEYNATIHATYVFNSSYSFIMHLLYGNIDGAIMYLSVMAVIAVLIGCSVGLWIFKKLNKQTLNRVIYMFMAVMGVMLMVKG